MSTSEEGYSYDNLDPKMAKKAQKELNENPQQVKAHIASLRRWVSSMPHISCPTDDGFLLRFLRTAKFDHSRAQVLLDNFCTVRRSPKGCPDWFAYSPVTERSMQEFLSKPFLLNLGRTDDGVLICLFVIKDLDPKKLNFIEMIRAGYMSIDLFCAEELSQITGFMVIEDLKDVQRSQTSQFENPRDMFQVVRNWQDAFPIRIKGFVYLNEPIYLDFLFKLFTPFMKEKLRKRMHRLGKDYDSKLRKLLGPSADRLLPAEYGGKNKTIPELIEDRRNVFLSEAAQKEWQKLASIHVDESKRPSLTQNYLRTFDGASDPSMGISGTFTKLDVN